MTAYRLTYAIARVLIGGMFIYTGIIHGLDPHGFSQAILAYQILPVWSINIFALCLPWIELLAGLAIATGIFIRGGALAASGMLIVFAIALAVSLYRGLDISCGCFTTSPEAARISWIYLVRDFSLLIVAVFIFQHPVLARGKQCAVPSSTRAKALMPVLVAFAVAGIFLFQHLTRDPCEGVTMDTIRGHKHFVAPIYLGQRPVNGLCEVLIKTENNIVPVYVGDTFVIAGAMFQDRKDITGEGLQRIISRNFQTLRHDVDRAVAFRYTPPGPIRHTLYLFASPTCPHCEEILEQIRPVLDENRTELRVLFKASGTAEALAIEAVCKKVNLESYLSRHWMSPAGTQHSTCKEGVEILDRSNELSRRLNITRVPTFFTERGLMLVGARLPALRALLKD